MSAEEDARNEAISDMLIAGLNINGVLDEIVTDEASELPPLDIGRVSVRPLDGGYTRFTPVDSNLQDITTSSISDVIYNGSSFNNDIINTGYASLRPSEPETYFVISNTDTNDYVKIRSDGNIEIRKDENIKELNLLDLLYNMDLLEEKIEILMRLLPRNFGSKILNVKKDL